MSQAEHHKSHRVGWLRASVLGANDGIVSNASLIIGVAAAGIAQGEIVLAGLAGLVAGAMSMAAGEYVSVSSQADLERADLALEQRSLEENREYEEQELADIYEQRGLSPELASEVARQLMERDALEAHAREELGISETFKARPIEAALSSGATFTVGASLPLLIVWLVPMSSVIPSVALTSLLFLALLGALAAKAGGAPVMRGTLRVTFWGTLAMAATAMVGHLFGGATI